MALDDDVFVDLANAVDENKTGGPDDSLDNISLHEIVSSNGGSMQEMANSGKVLTRVELELAYLSEKLLNLEIFLMDLSAKDGAYEALAVQNDNILDDSAVDELEFGFLSGILNSEVRELDAFVDYLQTQILDVQQKISSCEHFKEDFIKMEEKLHDSEEFLKKFKNQLLETRLQSAKLQWTSLDFYEQENGNDIKGYDSSENSQFPYANPKLMMHTAEEKKHILRMLEKSLERELDLEKKLSDSRQSEEELKLKLLQAELEAFCMEKESEYLWERLFEAQNAAELLMGISKELMGKLQIVQFNLNVSIQCEGETRSELEKSIQQSKTEEEGALRKLETRRTELDNFLLEQVNTLKAKLNEAEEKCILVYSEEFTLKEKIQSLEEQLKESEIQLQKTNISWDKSRVQQDVLSAKIIKMEDIIEDLGKNLSKAESMADNLEAKCRLLTETNLELNEEMDFLKREFNSGKVSMLEKQLKESNTQLQLAKASDEASREQQILLYSAIGDMENLIEDPKEGVLKSESIAQSAEAKCVLLSETNLELNEELDFLRGRVHYLEISLHQADGAKISTANDINIRTKVIADLVLQLAMERERLQKLIYSLTKENQILVEKSKSNASVIVSDIQSAKSSMEEGKVFLVTSFEEKILTTDVPASETDLGPSYVAEDAVLGMSNIETVRTIDIWQLNSKFFLIAILILLISVLAVWMFQQERCPF